MSAEFDFLTPDDKPALMGLTTNDLLDNAKAALDQLGYKVHAAANHGEFQHKFAQTPYQIVILEDVFGGGTLEENESLLMLQRMPMQQRRHTVIVLVGASFATFNPMQAFQQGVHSVVNPAEAFLLIQLIQKAVADNDIFLHTFRHAQQRLC
jgi:DNA-binding NtrC family response regulator